MEQSPDDPAKTEHDWLAALERESVKVSPQLIAMLPLDRPAMVAEAQAAVAYTRRIEDWYLSIVPTAEQLLPLGFGRLMRRLDELLAQIRTSRARCESVLLERVAAQQAAFPAPPPPLDPAAARDAARQQQQAEWEEQRKRQQAQFEAWEAAHRKQQEAFDAQNQAWSDRFNKH